eukprot:1486945-Pyramimonas_sp.AAC.1
MIGQSCLCIPASFCLEESGASVGAIMGGSPTATAVWVAAVTGIADPKLAALELATLRGECRVPPGTSVSLRLRVTPRGATRDPWVVVVCDAIERLVRCRLACRKRT